MGSMTPLKLISQKTWPITWNEFVRQAGLLTRKFVVISVTRFETENCATPDGGITTVESTMSVSGRMNAAYVSATFGSATTNRPSGVVVQLPFEKVPLRF